MAVRLSLTRGQLATAVGLELVLLLEGMTADGQIDAPEVQSLVAWLESNQSTDFPSVGHLVEVLNLIMADGRIEQNELLTLQSEIEKVLPPELRRSAQLKRREAAKKERLQRAEEEDEARRKQAALAPVGTFDFCVAGVAYDGRAQFIAHNMNRIDGADVELKRMPDNPHDRNAILLTVLSGELGYIPKDEAEWIAEFLDQGHRYKAVVKKILIGGRYPVPVIRGELFSPENQQTDGKLAACVAYSEPRRNEGNTNAVSGEVKLVFAVIGLGAILIFLVFIMNGGSFH